MYRLGLWKRYVGVLACLFWTVPALAEDTEGIAFFERKIRPVLVKECYQCHASDAKKVRGGLLLDTREGIRKGGDSGPAVVPGKPEESLLLDAIRHDFLAMPPKRKLPETVVADFVQWVERGAPDPRDGKTTVVKSGIDLDAGRAFWCYQPPRHHEPPAVADANWPRGAIDRAILAALEAKGLAPVHDADKATLLRRLYFDLVGLPPSPEEIDDFVHDPSPNAYEQRVDRLLASPRFGERWGRHWLDVARFGESLTLRGLIFKEAWRYRDYVIQSFNDDVPFDRFIQEQIAGDLLPAETLDDRRRQRIATTFLVLGNTNLEEQDKQQLRMDVVDEQIDTISKAFLAQTIACARCHDHKFDPIPTRDYYALAGILRNTRAMKHANVSEWLEFPLPVPAEQEAKLKAHEANVAALEAQIKEVRARGKSRSQTLAPASGAIPIDDVPGIVVDDTKAKKVGEWQESQFSKTYIGSGYLHDQNNGKGEKTLTFEPEPFDSGEYEVWLAYSPGGSRSIDVPVTVFSADGETPVPVNMKTTPPIDNRFVSLGRYRFRAQRSGLRDDLQRGDERARHGRRRPVPAGRSPPGQARFEGGSQEGTRRRRPNARIPGSRAETTSRDRART